MNMKSMLMFLLLQKLNMGEVDARLGSRLHFTLSSTFFGISSFDIQQHKHICRNINTSLGYRNLMPRSW